MIIPIKSRKQIETMKKGGQRLARVMAQVLRQVRPEMKLKDLDCLAEDLLKKQGGQPSFKMIADYQWATCLNVNQGVVHGVPGEYQLKTDDLLSVDMGLYFQGFHTDMARTVCVPNSKLKAPPLRQAGQNSKLKFLHAGEKALAAAIEAVRSGNRVGHISRAIEKEIKRAGFSPIESLTGHGVGQRLHEPPVIPCFLKGKIEKTPPIKPGMTLAIEVIYAQKRPEVKVGKDGWTMATTDGSLAGLFEETVLVTNQNPWVITKLDLNLDEAP